nr:ABC transporter ATP-binding protein [Micromonospora sp. DSM 115978]
MTEHQQTDGQKRTGGQKQMSRRRQTAGRLRVVGHVLGIAFRESRGQVAAVVLLVLVIATATAATGWSQRWLVDAAGLGSVPGVLAAVALGGTAHLLLSAGMRFQGNLHNALSSVVNVALNQEILGRAARIPTIEHLERPDYQDRLKLLRNNTYGLAASVWTITGTVAALLSVGLSMWLLATVHPVLAGLALLAVPPLWFAHRGSELVRRAHRTTAELTRIEQELHELCVTAEPAKETRIAGATDELDRHADRLWARVLDARRGAQVRSAGWQLFGWALYAAGFVAALGYVARLAADGRATAGDLVLVITLGSQLRGQIMVTAGGIAGVAQTAHAMDDYRWLVEYERTAAAPGQAAAPHRLRTGIALENVTFRYPGTEVEVLRDVSVRLPAGATVALVGVNGAGKTTLVKLLTGLYLPDAGRVTVDGVPLVDLDPAGWRARTSGAFQDFVKFQLTARHAVGVGDLARRDDDTAVGGAVTEAGAGSVVAGLPDGLDTQLGPVFGGAELSQGQWQKLALARGLMRTDPLLLVLDEPTAALDPQAEHDLFERFVGAARSAAGAHGTITLLISHRFSTVGMADLIIVLADGRIAESGTHTELVAAGGPYARLYAMQARSYR